MTYYIKFSTRHKVCNDCIFLLNADLSNSLTQFCQMESSSYLPQARLSLLAFGYNCTFIFKGNRILGSSSPAQIDWVTFGTTGKFSIYWKRTIELKLQLVVKISFSDGGILWITASISISAGRFKLPCSSYLSVLLLP